MSTPCANYHYCRHRDPDRYDTNIGWEAKKKVVVTFEIERGEWMEIKCLLFFSSFFLLTQFCYDCLERRKTGPPDGTFFNLCKHNKFSFKHVMELVIKKMPHKRHIFFLHKLVALVRLKVPSGRCRQESGRFFLAPKVAVCAELLKCALDP